MDSSPDRERSSVSDGVEDHAETDGGTNAGFDEVVLYGVVRNAVKDAILDVIGTLLLLGISFMGIWAGILAIGYSTVVGAALGGSVIVVSLYIAAATLEVIPPIREWF